MKMFTVQSGPWATKRKKNNQALYDIDNKMLIDKKILL